MTPEELKKFCADRDDLIYYIQEPFSHGDYTYATNGHIMVRIPRIEMEETERSRDAAVKLVGKAEKMFSDWSQAAEFLPIPAVELPPMSTCKDCGGTGKNAECPKCDGTKEVEFSNAYHDYEFTCKTCNGRGRIEGPCENCDGTGKIETFASTEVGNAKFQNKYLFMIAALPDSKIAPDGDGVAYFTFEGGDGVLMPTRK